VPQKKIFECNTFERVGFVSLTTEDEAGSDDRQNIRERIDRSLSIRLHSSEQLLQKQHVFRYD
jgi:hypothetical protein